MRHKYVVRSRENLIDGYTVVSKHRTPTEAMSSAWSFIKRSKSESRHLVVSVFVDDICIYRVVRSGTGRGGRHSTGFRYKSDYGDLSRGDAHYAVFEDDGGRIRPLVDYGNNVDSAVRSADDGKRRVLGFFTGKGRRFAAMWCTLLICAMVLFAVLCAVSVFTARSEFDQGVALIAVIISLVVVYNAVKYVTEYWRSCSYVNFDVMRSVDHFLGSNGMNHVE